MDANEERNLTGGDYQPWFMGEPNGLDVENCGVSWVRRDAWNDEECDTELCGFCNMAEAPFYTLRGCWESG